MNHSHCWHLKNDPHCLDRGWDKKQVRICCRCGEVDRMPDGVERDYSEKIEKR